MTTLSIQYLGLQLKSPVIIGSSGLTSTLSEVKEAAKSGAGAIVLKSIFEEQIQFEIENYINQETFKNDNPFQKGYDALLEEREFEYEMASAYLKDHAKEQTLSKYLTFISDCKKAVDVPIIASINCTSAYNWHYFARKIEEAGADALELNIFVLPSNILSNSAENEKVYFDIISAIKMQVKIPVTLKIGYYFSNLATTVIDLSKTGVDGLILFNRPFHPDINIDTFVVDAKYLLSDPSEYSNVLRWIAILSGRVGCPLVASTGVHSAQTAIKQILAGATAVQVVSAIYKNGFKTVESINNGISEWMKKHQFNTINDFKGKMSQTNIVNPADFERVQFMKLYSKI